MSDIEAIEIVVPAQPSALEIVTPAAPAAVEIVTGLQGPRGISGSDGRVLLTLVADEDIAAGRAVRIDRMTGKFRLALADDPNTSEVAGLATADALDGFEATATRATLTLADWTAITGAADLQPGVDYFLSATDAGQLVTVPPAAAGEVIALIGTALDTTTMIIDIAEPILL